MLEQYKDLLFEWNQREGRQGTIGHINVTGGEPFLRDDFFDLLEEFLRNKKFFSFGILTNGTLIDRKTAKKLKKFRPGFVQVSIEGTEATHDQIRGKENYRRVVLALKNLIREGIRTVVSFTAHARNYAEFADVARLGKRLGVNRVWADRLIPYGTGADLANLILSPEKTKEFFQIMRKAQQKSVFEIFSKTEIQMCRALQFLVGGGRPYACSAGDTLITILHDGTLLPCRRMPIPLGNVMQSSLRDLYYNGEIIISLRQNVKLNPECAKCLYARTCKGGLRCLSYALLKDPFAKDPGCWMKWEAETQMPQVRGQKSETECRTEIMLQV